MSGGYPLYLYGGKSACKEGFLLCVQFIAVEQLVIDALELCERKSYLRGYAQYLGQLDAVSQSQRCGVIKFPGVVVTGGSLL